MRWKQTIITERNSMGVVVKYMKTYETIHPFRSFKQSINNHWVLPKGIDELVSTMEKARLDEKWEIADTIRHSLLAGGIVVRNGKDWYPKLVLDEVKAERDFTSWLYSTSVSSGKSKESAQKLKDHFDLDTKRKYDI